MPDHLQPNPEPQIAMIRSDLSALPSVSLPNGYALRHFHDGDEAAWESIIGESFSLEDRAGMFDRVMRSDEEFLPERVCFVCRGDMPVATSSAWYRRQFGEHVGYLHYVGTLPMESGRGLGLQVSLACLHKMVAEGRSSVILHTDDFRLAAVKTYIKLGFQPLLVHENQRSRWRDIFFALGRPELTGSWADILAGPLYTPPQVY